MDIVICTNPVNRSLELVAYQGDIAPSAKYDPPNTFRMSTDISDFPFRVIYYKNTISINTNPVEYVEQKEEVRTVQGSKGNIYTVRTIGGVSTCSCPGFLYNKNCKHLILKDV